MKKQKNDYEQELKQVREQLVSEVKQWKAINELGCNDPFWADGANMNLVRNHIVYYKNKIEEICTNYGLSYPEEYYLPTPPKVDNGYMANLKQKDRVKRLEVGNKLTMKDENGISNLEKLGNIYDNPELLVQE